MATKTYSEKLKDPRWQKKRLEILNRDNFTCNLCNNSKKELHVHHKTYLPKVQPWNYPNHNFSTLCVDCHEEVHEIKDLLKTKSYNVISLLKKYSYSGNHTIWHAYAKKNNEIVVVLVERKEQNKLYIIVALRECFLAELIENIGEHCFYTVGKYGQAELV